MDRAAVAPPIESGEPAPLPPLARQLVLGVAAAAVAPLLIVASRYGYHRIQRMQVTRRDARRRTWGLAAVAVPFASR